MTVYDFTVLKSDGSKISLADYKGKVLAIVNTASYCGYTKQLVGLERDYEEFKAQGYEVLAFPCNQFRNQEPDPIDQIIESYHKEYGVTFPIFDKIEINGPNTHPLYTFLKEQIGYDASQAPPDVMIPIYEEEDPGYKTNPDIKWNFTKFLIDKEGNVRFRFEPEKTPSHMQDSIKQLLGE